jgi:hypothetical protein
VEAHDIGVIAFIRLLNDSIEIPYIDTFDKSFSNQDEFLAECEKLIAHIIRCATPWTNIKAIQVTHQDRALLDRLRSWPNHTDSNEHKVVLNIR